MYTLLLTIASIAAAAPAPQAGPQQGISRSPCPALNVLANIGKLPQDGRNITTLQFSSALAEIYNVDPQFTQTLVTAALAALPHTAANALDLSDLNKHDIIEHDASLTRNDAIQGDYVSPQATLVEALLEDARGTGSDDFITITSLAKTRQRRENESKQAGSPALSAKALPVAYGESALLLQALGHLGKAPGAEYAIPKAAAKRWLLDEQLPEGYTRPPKMITAASTTGLAGKITAARTVAGVGSTVLEGAAAVLGGAKGGAAPKGAGAKPEITI